MFGPVIVPSLGESMYYVSFIDNFSKSTWIYLLLKKYEVFDKFKEFKAFVENSTSKKTKVLRIEDGGEYIEKAFKNLCAKEGIKREWTTTTSNIIGLPKERTG